MSAYIRPLLIRWALQCLAGLVLGALIAWATVGWL